ncbi:unnamed protein product [Parascedosporium putredinis]|uniref:Major facilitator superfamily (MFS) profile domain-containing protein n=1 Tax=Parascedosporium putredinis TaxID=1442378 RepID=A0A9P1GYT4_9PEZI|nr:unnamed protein product [Parascedosporium putredinis]CAI7990993.1 unnamed protein product [Parascedosporium putredinis]
MIAPSAIESILAIFVPLIQAHREKSTRPFILGLSGLQGSGKSTWASALVHALNAEHSLCARTLSLDDLYFDYPQLMAIRKANPGNGLLQTRGQPGTHDETLAQEVFSKIKALNVTKENGWCLGFRPLGPEVLTKLWEEAKATTLNREVAPLISKSSTCLEQEDPLLVNTLATHNVGHLLVINANLQRYCETFTGPEHFDGFIHLNTDRLTNVYEWRLGQEKALREHKPGMSDTQVIQFVRGYMAAYELFLPRLQQENFFYTKQKRKVHQPTRASLHNMANLRRDSIEQQKIDDKFIEIAPGSVIEKGGILDKGDADYSGAVKKTDPAEIKLVRKLDWRIMPTLWAMYFLNYLDRNAIAQARLNGLEQHLGLVGTQYNTCISIFYLLMQIPSNMLISSKRVRPSVYMSVCMMAWAVVSASTALARDYKDLVVLRFFLGVTEAPFYPGALYILSIFYTRKEIATRLSILYSGNIFATSFSGLIAAAVFNTIDGHQDMKGWQWLFIIEGVLTFVIGIIGIFTLADSP